MGAPITLEEDEGGATQLVVQSSGLKSTRIAGPRTEKLLEQIPLLAVLATQAQGEGYRVLVVTGDRDSLQLVNDDHLKHLDFVNKLALAIIAMAAGNELVLKEFRSRFRSIAWITIGQAVTTLSLGITATFLLTGYLPFIQDLSEETRHATRLAISVLVGVILVARSPSSAIAIINELRAKGPFTQSVLGVTVIMDVAES